MNNQSRALSWMGASLSKFVGELSLSKSRPTVEAYRYDVGKFLEYVTTCGVKRMSTIKAGHIVDYLSDCKMQGKSESSVHRYYMSIRAYFRFLRRSKMVEGDLTQDITPPKCNQRAPYIPSLEQIERILSAPSQETESGVRDRAILELLYSSGLRASELCDLRIEDFKETGVIVRCGKRSKTRTVPLTEQASEAIRVYIHRYRESHAGFLFQTIMGKQIRRQLLSAMVSTYACKCNVEGVTTHTLRHACATHLLDQGADLRLIQEVLGHSSIASTQRYTHLSSQKIEQMFNKFHPRKKKESE